MANLNVATDAEVDQLIADVRKMMRELEQVADRDKDTVHRLQARRWLDTLHRFADYALQGTAAGCRDGARRA